MCDVNNVILDFINRPTDYIHISINISYSIKFAKFIGRGFSDSYTFSKYNFLSI